VTGLEAAARARYPQVLRTNNPAAGQIAHDQARLPGCLVVADIEAVRAGLVGYGAPGQ